MASLDSLPADQRAVLQLVLQRGRSYDDIAQLLSIDRAAVRERALSAFDALGPGTRVAPERRALITDYLLGQLPPRVAESTHDRLAQEAGERAWARVVASELGTLSSGPLPEIPVEGGTRAADPEPRSEGAVRPIPPPPPQPQPDYEPADVYEPADEYEEAGEHEPVAAAPSSPASPAPAPPRRRPRPAAAPAGGDGGQRPSSRRGGAILLGGGLLLLVAVIVAVILISNNGSSPTSHSSTVASSSTTSAPSQSTATTNTQTSGTASAKPIAQITLTSPTAGSKTKGAAVVVQQGTTTAIEIIATGVPANTAHDAYAVWLYNSPTDAQLLGFVSPGIKANGVLRTVGPLTKTASRFKQLLVTRETQAKPHAPGPIILQGPLNLPA